MLRGQFGDEERGVDGSDTGYKVIARLGWITLDGDGLAALGEADRVGALGDVDDPGCLCRFQAVEGGIDQPQVLPAYWSAMATMPANSGHAALVPPPGLHVPFPV